MTEIIRKTKIATAVAWKFVGTPYKWGGDDPSGFDCSGFVLEILQSVGHIKPGNDMTAAQIIEKYKTTETPNQTEGCLIGYKNTTGKIVHIEYAIDEFLTIGASGGGARTNTIGDAWRQNAYIKVRPTGDRKKIIVSPFR